MRNFFEIKDKIGKYFDGVKSEFRKKSVICLMKILTQVIRTE